MGALLDKLDRASRGASRPLGFGSAAQEEQVAPVLLLGVVDAGDEAAAKLAAEARVDAVLVRAEDAKKADLAATHKALGGLLHGLWREQATADGPQGDFQVFSSDETPMAALGGEERTNVMAVSPEVPDELLRTLDLLPVDAFLVSLTDVDALNVRQLMRLGRVRGVTSRWLFAELAALPSKEELEQLRDVGVAAVAVALKGQTAETLAAARTMLAELPREQPERTKSRSVATVPQVSGALPGGRPAPEPEPDDEDYDDE
jgi:hypothetical protein